MDLSKLLKKNKINAEKLNKDRLERCVPIAKEIIKMIGVADLDVGEEGKVDREKYDAFSMSVLAFLLKQKLKYSEREFVFQLVLQAFDFTQKITLSSLEKGYGICRDKVWGKDYMDIDMEDLDNILKGEK